MSRLAMLLLALLCLGATILPRAAWAVPPTLPSTLAGLTGNSIVNVKTFGAKEDGVTNDVPAIVAGHNYLSIFGGGTLLFNSKPYKILTQYTIPLNVTDQGTYYGAMAHTKLRDGAGANATAPTGEGGTTLLQYGGSGTTVATSAMVTVQTNGSIRGMCFYNPNIARDTAPPTAYPPMVALRGSNPNMENCELLNAYIGIDVNNVDGTNTGITQRCTVRNITGQPLFIGVRCGNANDNVGGTYTGILDCPRFENIQFNPWFSYPQAGTSVPGTLFTWQKANGTAFSFVDNDELYCVNCFAFGYNVGMKFSSVNRGTYGAIIGGGMDTCNVGYQVNASQTVAGLRFSGLGLAGSPFQVGASAGPVLITNSVFFGGSVTYCLDSSSADVVSLTGCTFNNWTTAGVHVNSGRLIVTGSEFKTASNQIVAVGGAVIASGNFCKTAVNFTGVSTSTGNVAF